MNETRHEEHPDDPVAADEPSPLRVALGFFILPLLLVLGGVGVFLLFGVLAHDPVDPVQYLAEINGRGINEPWQAAFHLSQALQHNEQLVGDETFARQVVRAFERADDADPRVRRFLCIALGRLEHPIAFDALVDGSDDDDAEVRLNCVWALGTIGDAAAGEAVAARLRDEDSSVRTIAAYVLGVLEPQGVQLPLQVALNDAVPAVRWNAAVALGRMGDRSALPTLERMIDRDYLATVAEVAEPQHSETMLAALAALERLGVAELEDELIALRDSDPDLRVREAARRALERPIGLVTSDDGTLLAHEQ